MRGRVITLLLFGLAGAASAQLALPPRVEQTVGGVTGAVGQIGQGVDQTLQRTGQAVDQTLDRTTGALGNVTRSAQTLVQNRTARLDSFVRTNRQSIERDDLGEPARRGVVLFVDPDPAALATAKGLGFTAQPVAGLETLGLAPVALSVPEGMSLANALRKLRAALPGKTLGSDAIHFPSGAQKGGTGAAPAAMPPVRSAVGLIDGGVGGGIDVANQRGFAAGGPVASDHGTAIASLLRTAGVTRVLSADVYGKDPAGGNALAIAQALDWFAREKVPVVSVSLVGPRNLLLERAIAAASARGMTIVAAVGNDGPSAPPAFPASYPSVLAITGVDGRDRALIEAGHALHLDYAAPGADMKAPNARGRPESLRGTSYAVPFVAARAAAAADNGKTGAALRAALDAEARDLGRKGPDDLYGRGLICGNCAPR